MGLASVSFRQLVRVFESQGMSNPVQIAESIAFLLLVKEFLGDEWQLLNRQPHDLATAFARQHEKLRNRFSGLHLPTPPSERIGTRLGEIMNLLQGAINTANRTSIGEFFQQDVRAELLRTATSGQYPTPDHIAQFMALLAINKDTIKVLDPTAGTGGLLAAAHTQKLQIQCVGIDYDPQWAGMGSANLALNQAEGAEYHLDLALSHYSQIHNSFDAVVMNPPFGGTLDATQVIETIGNDYGRDRSTVLAGLALAALKTDGIAAFLLPSGALFGGGGALHLRNILTKDYQLEAVITLPPNAFQPYSQVATHLFLARKVESRDAIWFCSLIADGYPDSAGRDLTEPPKANENELPRTRDLLLHTRENQWMPRLILESNIAVQVLQLDSSGLGGAAVRLSNFSNDVDWQIAALPNGIMARLYSNNQMLGWLYQPYSGDDYLAFQYDQVEDINWQERLSYNNPAQTIPSEWQGADDVSLEVNNSTITLKKGRTTVTFDASTASSSENHIGCLLDESGIPLTPWLSTTENFSKIDLVESFNALSIADTKETQIGWLLNLSTSSEESQQGFLLIVRNSHVVASLFSDGDGSHYALLANGWIKITAENSMMALFGKAVDLRADIKAQGIAIGHDPRSTTAEHRLFGVLLPSSDSIIADMRPSRFLPEQPVTPLGNPSQIIASIRRSQTDFNIRLDSVLGMIGEGLVYGDNPDQVAPLPPWITTLLDAHQQSLLELIQSKQSNDTPSPFNLQILLEWSDKTYTSDELSQQLLLLVQLGLIKEVRFRGQNEQILNMYRLITHKDIRSTESSTSVSKEASE